MSIHVALNHVTHYRYDRRVALSAHVVRLRPAPHSRTRILSYSLRIVPARHFINWQQDPQSNYLARVVFPERTEELRIEVDLIAEMAVLNPFDFFLEPHAAQFPFAYTAEERSELAPYLVKAPAGALFTAYLASIPRSSVATADFLVDLNGRLARDVRYLIRLEPGVQTPEETLANASGSCRDTGWLLVQLLRHLGLAARFASGYLIQLAADQKSLDGPSGASADFADLHAWCEVYLPGAGWIGLDPTSGLLAGEGHIPLACTPEPSSAAPVSGTVEECAVEFQHTLRVDRVWEAPRVTKPYTEAQWTQIELLGRAIDQDLDELDVRLTMGGEPTFVSVDDSDGAEWNTAALGEKKRNLAIALFARLVARYAPGGLVHFGQGKWYPGEQLPRWSLNCFWRRDGDAIWRSHALYADETRDYGATAQSAHQFLVAFAERLGLSPEFVFAAHEDPFYYEWRERRLPANVDGRDSRLDDASEGARLARLADKGLDTVTGHVLPIARTRPARIGRRVPGSCGASAAISCREIPLWVCGCRSIRCPGRRPPTVRSCMRRIPHRSSRRCPLTRRSTSGSAHRRPGRQNLRHRGRRAATSRHTGSTARRSAPSRATVCSTSSCRRRSNWRIISNSSPLSRLRRRRCRNR